jgi:nitrogen fixation-related uncharacterized protein
MPDIKYDENPENPLNKKIFTAWGTKNYDEFKKVCREIYEIGIEDGQTFLWKLRSGQFDSVEVNPDLPDHVKQMIKEQMDKDAEAKKNLEQTITVTNNANKEIDFVEMINGKLTMRHGIPDDKWGTR